MNKRFLIKEPCKQDWDSMKKIHDGRHCEYCDKKIWDLDLLSELETNSILKENREICGKISYKSPLLSSIILSITLSTTTHFLAQSNSKTNIENVYQKEITIKGKLISIKKQNLISGEISLVTLDKLYSAKADNDGNFTLNFPEKALNEYNVISINCLMTDNKTQYHEENSSIISNKELLGKEKFPIEKSFTTIGGVYYTIPKPPDYYFFDGKKVSKRKFEKIKKNNLSYKYLVFYEEVFIHKIIKKNFVNNLYLLYSN